MRSNTENHPKVPSTAGNIHCVWIGHYRMDVLDSIIDGSKVLYKSIFIHVRLLNWKDGGIIWRLAGPNQSVF